MQESFFKTQSSAGKLPTYVELLRFSVRPASARVMCTDIAPYLTVSRANEPCALVMLKLEQRARYSVQSRWHCGLARIEPGRDTRGLSDVHIHVMQNLTVGAKVWGAVQEVTVRRLVVALPHGLRGFVTPAAASDVLRSLMKDKPSKEDKRLRSVLHGQTPTLPDLFYPGQFVRGIVSQLDEGDVATDVGAKLQKVCHSVLPMAHCSWIPDCA